MFKDEVESIRKVIKQLKSKLVCFSNFIHNIYQDLPLYSLLRDYLMSYIHLGNGVNIITALGHSGFKMDQRIAKEVDGVDLVVGGHSNTFLYHGTPPKARGAIEKPEETYPYIVRNNNGQDVPVVSAYKYSKYLGYLKLQVKDKKLIPMEGSNPILLDKTYKQGKSKTIIKV